MNKNLSLRIGKSAKTMRGNPDKTIPYRWQPGQTTLRRLFQTAARAFTAKYGDLTE